MPQSTLPPDQGGSIERTVARVERLERRTTSTVSRPPVEMTFSYPGTLSASVESPPWYPTRAGQITTIRVSTTATVSGSLTMEVRVNGSAAPNHYTLSSGLTAVFTDAIIVTLGSYVTVKTISVGTNSNASVVLTLT